MLENFRTQKIIWDRANKKIFEAIEANSGDSNGRKLVVQVINQEVTEVLSGTTLSLGWKSRKGAKGLDAFDVVDASKGIFEIYYTTEMLSNIGNIEASLILIDSTGRIESSAFTISVRPSTVDDESVESENSFTALTEALVKVNDFSTQLARKVDKGGVTLADINKNGFKLDQTYLSESVLQQMAGTTQVNAVVEDNSITNSKLVKNSVNLNELNKQIFSFDGYKVLFTQRTTSANPIIVHLVFDLGTTVLSGDVGKPFNVELEFATDDINVNKIGARLIVNNDPLGTSSTLGGERDLTLDEKAVEYGRVAKYTSRRNITYDGLNRYAHVLFDVTTANINQLVTFFFRGALVKVGASLYSADIPFLQVPTQGTIMPASETDYDILTRKSGTKIANDAFNKNLENAKEKEFELYMESDNASLAQFEKVYDFNEMPAGNLTVTLPFISRTSEVTGVHVKIYFNNSPLLGNLSGSTQMTYPTDNVTKDNSVTYIKSSGHTKGSNRYAHVFVMAVTSAKVPVTVDLYAPEFEVNGVSYNTQVSEWGGFRTVAGTFRQKIKPNDNTIATTKAAATLIEQYAQKEYTSKWSGKKAVGFGDSIMWQDGKLYGHPPVAGTMAVGYMTLASQKLGFSFTNLAASGATIVDSANSIYQKVLSTDVTGFDFALIAGGTNDFGSSRVLGELGDVSDTVFDITTVYGAYRAMIENMLTQKPTLHIYLISPLQRDTGHVANARGLTLADYNDAILKIAEMYSLPVLNLYGNSGINKNTFATFTRDGLHPMNVGYERIERVLTPFLENN